MNTTSSPGPEDSFIHLAGVSKTYRTGRKAHLAISDATFDVQPGELVALVGPSGCGKVRIHGVAPRALGAGRRVCPEHHFLREVSLVSH